MNKNNIIKKTRDYQKVLGLQNWDIDIKFLPIKETKGGFTVNAKCEPNSTYLQATITFNTLQKNIYDETIIHELCHCITSEIIGYADGNDLGGNWLDYFNERLTSHIAHIFINVLKSKLK